LYEVLDDDGNLLVALGMQEFIGLVSGAAGWQWPTLIDQFHVSWPVW